MTSAWRQSLILLLLAAATATSMSCKEGDPLEPGIVPAIASFAADTPPAGVTDDLITLRVSSAAGGRIVLDVVVTEVAQPITGVDVKLTYPDTFSKFVSCSDGDLFPAGQCFFREPAPGSGEVFIGRNVSQAQASSVPGSKVAVRLEFLVFAKGTGPIRFEGQNLGGGDASAVLDINGDPHFVQWYSGMLQGR